MIEINLFAHLPPTEIIFKRRKVLTIRTHGNGYHCIGGCMREARIFVCDSDNFTKVFDPEKNEDVEKLIAPFRIAYQSTVESKLYDFQKENWRDEAMQLIQKAIDEDKDELTFPNFFEREWLKNRRLKN